MGLCKCPKRKVTNLFCFEHRVNVCEHCLVENHSRCVVKSYLNWLKDSDYDPNCQLCNKPLYVGNVVRLLCYDVFHEACVDRYFKKLPGNTAPAGYKCSSCDMEVFPLPNQAGKVVEQMRSCLSKYNWARVGLGMPLIEESEIIEMPEENSSDLIDAIDHDARKDPEPLHGIPKPDFHFSQNSSFTEYDSSPPKKIEEATELTMNEYEYSPMTGTMTDGTVPRKIYGGNDLPDSLKQTVAGHDPDGKDKYKRRPAWTWLMRWIKSRMLRGRSRAYHDFNVIPKKAVILLVVGIIALFTIIIFATQVGRKRAEDNPFLDPMANPNIHIAHHGDDEAEKIRLGMRRAGPLIHDDKL